jgi:uncharacterized MAPEG superfamily protein
MSVPLLTLLGFALWTLLLLMLTVGVYRWQLILTGRAAIHAFPADAQGGAAWYQRATRAHVNCIENLPVYAAIVFALTQLRIEGPLVDILCCSVLGARLCQTTIHVSVVQTARAVSFRFSFFTVQLLSMLWLIGLIGVRVGA